jgi:hypothetical protein
MSHGLITEDFADGTYQFRIGYGEWQELDDLLKVGPPELLQRLRLSRWMSNYPREIIRLGLIGGGMNPVKALQLVRTYVEGRGIFDSIPLAMSIIVAAAFSPEASQSQGEAETVTKDSEESISPPSTETLQ